MSRLFKKRQQIDPKTLRKHSRIVNERAESLLVVGERNQTDFGYEVSGYSAKSFETLYFALMPNATTPTWRHAKKTRVYRVASGVGHYQKIVGEDDDGQVEVDTRPLSAGDEVVVEPGDAHRITATTKLELYVTQDSKYAAHLEEVAPAEQLVEVPSNELVSLSAEDKMLRTGGMTQRRTRSKAVEQMRMLRGESQAFVESRKTLHEETVLRGGDGGVNAMPVLDLSEEGAG